MEMSRNGEFRSRRSDEIIEVLDSPSPIDVDTNAPSSMSLETSPSTDNEVIYINSVQEEPIDLTYDKYLMSKKATPTRIIIQPQLSPNNMKGLKRNADGFFIRPEIAAKQQEVLKMAKSVFSKRTRTLYHWMYPGASKQQIKQVVSNTWESMAAQERNIYVAQVLGKFGCHNANLMVNPQLGQIKDLPPIPGVPKINGNVSELQEAISSISSEVNEPDFSAEEPRKKMKIGQKKAGHSVAQEFDDDPELSQELAQFSTLLKNQIM